jgi:hypothetical protein
MSMLDAISAQDLAVEDVEDSRRPWALTCHPASALDLAARLKAHRYFIFRIAICSKGCNTSMDGSTALVDAVVK